MKPLTMRDKAFWRNLDKHERSRLMFLQMAPAYGGNDGYLPDDCSACGVCGNPVVGSGWCDGCYQDWSQLYKKGQGLITDPTKLTYEQRD